MLKSVLKYEYYLNHISNDRTAYRRFTEKGQNITLMHTLTDLYTISKNEAWYVLVMIGYDVCIKMGPNA